MKTEIGKIRANIMGTISFEMKASGHRGFQEFIVYPINGNTEIVLIQSDKRWGQWSPKTGEIRLNKSNASRANSVGFMMDEIGGNIITVKLSEMDNSALKMRVFASTSKEAGKQENGIMQSDNSGAINIFDL